MENVQLAVVGISQVEEKDFARVSEQHSMYGGRPPQTPNPCRMGYLSREKNPQMMVEQIATESAAPA